MSTQAVEKTIPVSVTTPEPNSIATSFASFKGGRRTRRRYTRRHVKRRASTRRNIKRRTMRSALKNMFIW